jgi:hypothetical protein
LFSCWHLSIVIVSYLVHLNERSMFETRNITTQLIYVFFSTDIPPNISVSSICLANLYITYHGLYIYLYWFFQHFMCGLRGYPNLKSICLLWYVHHFRVLRHPWDAQINFEEICSKLDRWYNFCYSFPFSQLINPERKVLLNLTKK